MAQRLLNLLEGKHVYCDIIKSFIHLVTVHHYPHKLSIITLLLLSNLG